MKLLICEYVTAGGLGRARGHRLLDEADAILHALARDFSAVPDVRVTLLRCPSLPALDLPGVRVLRGAFTDRLLDSALADCDAAVLVAPESDAILHRLTVRVESLGVRVLGSQAGAVACAGDKWATWQALERAAVAQIPTLRFDSDWLPRAGPWVLKPADGCGCEGLRRFADQASAHQALLALAHVDASAALAWIAQPWLDGSAASLTVLGSAHGPQLLSVNRQVLRLLSDGGVALDRVETGAGADPDRTLAALAAAVHGAIPGLRGIYGIDVLMSAQGPLVVDVNPRVTSAYPALQACLQSNPAQRWLAAATADSGPTLGWDLGGAHLKVAALAPNGQLLEVIQRPCALWQGLDRLLPLLDELCMRWGRPARHALTMSGEMVDLFADRSSGVRALIDAFALHAGDVPIQVYAGPHGFLAARDCRGRETDIASANWLASADWAARHLPCGILFDIGSTTTDLVCFDAGAARPAALGDADRLASDELVYTGVTRTPLMALARRVALAGRSVGVMAEHFATTADVYRLLGQLPDGADQHPSADGAPKTVENSLRRIARMVGCDGPEHPIETWVALAEAFRAQQLHQVGVALDRALARLAALEVERASATVVLAGVGRFLASALCAERGLRWVEFSTLPAAPRSADALDRALSEGADRCAPAFAVAALARSASRQGDPPPASGRT